MVSSRPDIRSDSDDLIVWSASSDKPYAGSIVEESKVLLEDSYSSILRDLLFLNIQDKKFHEKLFHLKEDMMEIVEAGKPYSFNGFDLNGITGIVLTFVDLLVYIRRENYLEKPSAVSEITQVLLIFEYIVKDMKTFLEKRVQDNNSVLTSIRPDQKGLVNFNSQRIDGLFKLRDELEQQIETVWQKFPLFWIRNKSRVVAKLMGPSIAFSVSRFPSCLKILSKNFVGRRVSLALKYTSYETPLGLASWFDSWIGRRIFRLLSYNSQVSGKSFSVPAQGRWIIPDEGLDVVKYEPAFPVHHQVPCRLLTHRSKANLKKIVIIHLHGGGLVLANSDVHEIYTKKFVADLEGAAILTPDFILRAKYPLQFQDVLDVYLWLTSGDQSVEETLGFRPESIILIGDSAGGSLALSLLDICHKIEAKDAQFNFVVPKALVFFYGAFYVHSPCSPSRMCSFSDVLVTERMCLACGGIVGGVEGHEERPSFSKNAVVRFLQQFKNDCRKLSYLISSPIKAPWYMNNGAADVDLIYQVISQMDNTFLYSLAKMDYSRFVESKLYLVTTNKCLFLDDNIDLARMWQGYVQLHVLKNQVHGFLAVLSEDQALRFSVNILREAINTVQT